jgi:hypothetical protein
MKASHGKSIEGRLTARVSELFRNIKANGDPGREKMQAGGDIL